MKHIITLTLLFCAYSIGAQTPDDEIYLKSGDTLRVDIKDILDGNIRNFDESRILRQVDVSSVKQFRWDKADDVPAQFPLTWSDSIELEVINGSVALRQIAEFEGMSGDDLYIHVKFDCAVLDVMLLIF